MSYIRGTPGFIGPKLSQARILRRMNVSTLAGVLGLGRATVSAYEKGKITPSPEVMGNICNCLNMPLDFFVSDSSPIPETNTPVFYRSHATSLKLARDSAELKSRILASVAAYLEQYIDFPNINLPKFDLPSDPTTLNEEKIRKIAEKTRTYWGLSLGPISDLVCLLENNGILVGRYPFNCKRLDAFSHYVDNQPQIIIGADKGSAVRQRFDASHELGHLILHRNIPAKLVKDKDFHQLLEDQANCFAFDFLFPSKAFKAEVRRCSLNEFLRLKRKWKVSVAAQARRASEPDMEGKIAMKTLFQTMGRRGWKTSEPYDDEFICEVPRFMKEGLDLILESNTQSPKDISNYFKMQFSDIEEIAGLPQGYFSNFSQGSVLELKKDRGNSGRTQDTLSAPTADSPKVASFLDAFAQRK